MKIKSLQDVRIILIVKFPTLIQTIPTMKVKLEQEMIAWTKMPKVTGLVILQEIGAGTMKK